MGITTTYTVRELLWAWNKFKAHPDERFLMRHDWPQPAWNLADWRAWFLACLQRKINRDDPRATWRKMQDGYQIDLAHDRQVVDDYYRRHIICPGGRGLLRTKAMQARYPHVNCQERD